MFDTTAPGTRKSFPANDAAPPVWRGPERRSALRSPAALPISVREAARRQLPAMLTSLSPLGGRLGSVTLGANASALWVRLPGLESLAARCVWHTPGAVGFEFERPLHPAVASRFYRQAAPDEAPARPTRENVLFERSSVPLGETFIASPRDPRRRAVGAVDQRLEGRFPAPPRAVLGFRLAGRPATLHDISPSGLMVTADQPVAVGAPVAVGFAGYPDIAGHIAWSRNGSAGVRLPDNALDLFEAA